MRPGTGALTYATLAIDAPGFQRVISFVNREWDVAVLIALRHRPLPGS